MRSGPRSPAAFRVVRRLLIGCAAASEGVITAALADAPSTLRAHCYRPGVPRTFHGAFQERCSGRSGRRSVSLQERYGVEQIWSIGSFGKLLDDLGQELACLDCPATSLAASWKRRRLLAVRNASIFAPWR